MSNDMEKKSIYQDIPSELPEELFDTMVETGSLRLERIVSRGHTTPIGQWYDQDHDEWVMVVRGSAVLIFESDGRRMVMEPGDYVIIPAHERHRVEWTSEHEDTVWIALHYGAVK